MQAAAATASSPVPFGQLIRFGHLVAPVVFASYVRVSRHVNLRRSRPPNPTPGIPNQSIVELFVARPKPQRSLSTPCTPRERISSDREITAPNLREDHNPVRGPGPPVGTYYTWDWSGRVVTYAPHVRQPAARSRSSQRCNTATPSSTRPI